MSLWQEQEEQSPATSSAMTDIVFRIRCEQLPVDHATALAHQITEKSPVLGSSPKAGIHQIHVAGSQNGWERPERDGEPLCLSKRTRLRVRADKSDAENIIQALTGETLDVAGYPLQILNGTLSPLAAATTLFARYTWYRAVGSNDSESDFVDAVIHECGTLGFKPNKLLCGKAQTVASDLGDILTRSVLIADVSPPVSIVLQEHGLGDLRTIGCGLLIPHKDTNAVSPAQH